MWHTSKELPMFVYLWSPDMFLRSYHSWLYLTSRHSVSFGKSSGKSGQVHEWWERYHNDQANIWQVCPNMNILQINHSSKQHDNIHLAPRTMHNCWCICHIHQSWERYFTSEFIHLLFRSSNLATMVFQTLTAITRFILMRFHSNANYTFHGTKNGDGNIVRV